MLWIQDVYPDPGSDFFPSRIQGLKHFRIPEPIRIRIKEFKYFNPLDFFHPSRIPGPGSRGQKALDTGPQIRIHNTENVHKQKKRRRSTLYKYYR